jgi:hypothetical protein
MGILNTLLRAVTWWNGQTLNTQFYTWRRGVKVGEDAQGNAFFTTKLMASGGGSSTRARWRPAGSARTGMAGCTTRSRMRPADASRCRAKPGRSRIRRT